MRARAITGYAAAFASIAFAAALLKASRAAESPVKVEEITDYQGQDAFRVTTPAATYVYHKRGAGFAAIVDPDGRDWITYRPIGGSAGSYRGIPNVIHPEGGFHPGTATCSSRLVESGPEKVVIASESTDGKWACTWTIAADRATMDLETVGHPYWILYEGTPGGAYDETQAFMVDSSRRRQPCTSRWERRLPEPRWIYFGTPASPYVLYLIDHMERPADTLDSFWSMQKNMTVFGFGRVLSSKSSRWKHLTTVPARLTVGLMDGSNPGLVARKLTALAAKETAL